MSFGSMFESAWNSASVAMQNAVSTLMTTMTIFTASPSLSPPSGADVTDSGNAVYEPLQFPAACSPNDPFDGLTNSFSTVSVTTSSSCSASEPLKANITAAQLSTLFPDAGIDYLDQVASELNTDLNKYGLDTPLRRAHFFAQVKQEAGSGLQSKVENLNYSPAALKATFSYYTLNPDEADEDGYERDTETREIVRSANQEEIANKAYADRNGNGDIASGDGWRYRGRGLIQVTGRSNYAALTSEYKALYGASDVDFEKNPELLEQLPYSIRSAVCFWVLNGLPKLADNGSTDSDVDAITAVVNRGTDSYGEREDNFDEAYQVFK